jgi:hypothetical protein
MAALPVSKDTSAKLLDEVSGVTLENWPVDIFME